MTLHQVRDSTTVLTVAVSAALFADSLVYSAIVPVLPTYASQHRASPAAIGVLFASYAAVLLATPPFAALSDRHGRRAPLIAGMVGVTAATLLFALERSGAGAGFRDSFDADRTKAVLSRLAAELEQHRQSRAVLVVQHTSVAGIAVNNV